MAYRKKVFPVTESRILQLYEAGTSQTDIGRQLDVSQSVVSKVIRKAGISRGPGPNSSRTVTAPGSALTPATLSPEIFSLQEIISDETVAADVRLLAVQKLRTLEAQTLAPVRNDDGEIDFFACDQCQQLGAKASWDCYSACPFGKAFETTKPASPAPVALDAATQELISWFEQQESEP